MAVKNSMNTYAAADVHTTSYRHCHKTHNAACQYDEQEDVQLELEIDVRPTRDLQP